LPIFGCHGKAICSLKNSDSIFEFANPDKMLSYRTETALQGFLCFY